MTEEAPRTGGRGRPPSERRSSSGAAFLRLCLALVLFGGACGRSAASTRTPPPTPASTVAAATTTTVGAGGAPTNAPATATAPAAPASSTSPPPRRIITIGMQHAAGSLDPASAVDEVALTITRHMYDGLTGYQPGTAEPAAALAERWETSADGLTWTFHLRPGVRFSDGTPLTAETVRANFERWWRAAPAGPYVFWQALFGGFAGEAGPDGELRSKLIDVTAAGADQLVLTLAEPDGSLPNTLAMPSFAIVSAAVLASGHPEVDLNRASAGTGRYVLAEWPRPELIRLERNPLYWGSDAAGGPDELIFKTITDDTQRLLALQTGELEGMARPNPADYAGIAADGANTRLEFDPALNVLYLGFNQAHSPWQNLDCRLAVALALNRQRYATEFYPGDAELAHAMAPPAAWGYAPAAAEYAFDPPRAKLQWQACVESGVTIPLTVTLFVPPEPRIYLPDPAGMGKAIQADLAAALDVDIVLASPPWQTEWLPAVHAGQADLFLLGWTGVNGDAGSFLCPLFCGAEGAFNQDSDGQPTAPDLELAAILEQMRAATDPAVRAELYGRAQQRIYETVPAIPIAHRQAAWAFQKGVTGSIPSPVESLFFDLRLAP